MELIITIVSSCPLLRFYIWETQKQNIQRRLYQAETERKLEQMEQSPQVSSDSQALAELRHTHSSFSSCHTPNTTCQFAGLSKLQNFPSLPLTRQCCCSPASLSAVSTPPLPQHPSNHLVYVVYVSIRDIFTGSDELPDAKLYYVLLLW